MQQVIDDIAFLARCCDEDERRLVLVVSSSKESSKGAYVGGIRCLRDVVIVSVVNCDQYSLRQIAKELDGRVSLVMADSDKKAKYTLEEGTSQEQLYSNLVSESYAMFKKSSVRVFSSAEITVNAVMTRLRQIVGNDLNGQRVALVGIGNIGFRICLRLVEEGVDVNCVSRSYESCIALTNAVNRVKSSYTQAKASFFKELAAATGASDGMIHSTSSSGCIKKEHVWLRNRLGFILDVGKYGLEENYHKECISQKRLYSRVDVGGALVKEVVWHLDYQEETFSPKKRFIKEIGLKLVSGGSWVESEGDLIVDDAESPQFSLGFVDKDNIFRKKIQRFTIESTIDKMS